MLKRAVFTVFSYTILIWKVFNWKPVSKPNYRLFIRCFEREKSAVSMVQNILQKKKNQPNLFPNRHCFWGIFKKWYRNHELDKQNAINRYSQRKEIRTCRPGTAHSKVTILGVEQSRQECLGVLIILIWLQSFNYFAPIQKKIDENSQLWNNPISNYASIKYYKSNQ